MDNQNLPPWVSEHIPSELVNSTLFRFNVTMAATEIDTDGRPIKRTVTVDMLPDLDVDYDILQKQLEECPARYVYWASLYSEVRLTAAIAERRLKARRGQATEEVQRRASQENVKLTADQIKAIVEADDKLVEADLLLQEAQMKAGKLYHMVEAMRMKAESLRSLAGFKRQEMQH